MARPKYWDVWRDVRKTVKTVAEQELRHAWKQSELRPLGLRYLDSRFRALPAKVYKKVLAYNTVDRSRYKSEHFDCDIFAVFLAGDVATGPVELCIRNIACHEFGHMVGLKDDRGPNVTRIPRTCTTNAYNSHSWEC